jgi:hypothetical protein
MDLELKRNRSMGSYRLLIVEMGPLLAKVDYSSEADECRNEIVR